MAVGLAIAFVLLIGHTLVGIAGTWSAVRARLWGPLVATLVAGVAFDLQALPPWPPRVSLWDVGIALASSLIGIVLVNVAAQAAPNAEVERQIRSRSSALVGLACIEGALLVALGFAVAFVLRD